MELETSKLSEVSQTTKDKYRMFSPIQRAKTKTMATSSEYAMLINKDWKG